MNRIDEQRRDIVLNIYRASNLLERISRGIAAQHGLTSVQQWFIIGALYRSKKGELSLKELSDNILVTKQNMTGMVKRLEQSGHLATSKDPFDRRSTLVKLTESGLKVFESLRQSAILQNVQTFAILNEAETEEFSFILQRLVDDMQGFEESYQKT